MQWAALRSSCNNNTKKRKKRGGGKPSARFAITKYENKYINKYKFKNGHIFITTVTKSGEIVV